MKLISNLIIFILLLNVPSILISQNDSTIYRNVLIASNLESLSEPSISQSAKNPIEYVVGCNLDAAFHSVDGGINWDYDTLGCEKYNWGDPCIVSNTKGDFFFFHLQKADNANEESRLEKIVCQKYNPLRNDWIPIGYIACDSPKSMDKEWACVDTFANSPYKNRIYLGWTLMDEFESNKRKDSSNIYFSYSDNGGKDWAKSVKISQLPGNCEDKNSTTSGTNIYVGLNGTLYLTWANRKKIYFDRSFDGGKTWLAKDVEVAKEPNGWYYEVPGLSRAIGFPTMSCDVSQSAYRGNLYISWSDQRNGKTDTDVFLVVSKDSGSTWTKPIKVNDDGLEIHNFMSSMTTDPATGYIYVVFYDRRRYKNNNLTDVYLAISKDGGNSFENIKINRHPFMPVTKGFLGDYISITAKNGIVRPAWMQMNVLGKTYLYTAIIDDGGAAGLQKKLELKKEKEKEVLGN
jgi:hypothetical protein